MSAKHTWWRITSLLQNPSFHFLLIFAALVPGAFLLFATGVHSFSSFPLSGLGWSTASLAILSMAGIGLGYWKFGHPPALPSSIGTRLGTEQVGAQDLTLVTRGTLLVASATPFPSSVSFDSRPCSPGWRSLKRIDSQDMKTLMSNSGWHFLGVAAERKTTVWGFDRFEALKKGFRLITEQAEALNFNCLEVKKVDTRKLLGISFFQLTARLREIRPPVPVPAILKDDAAPIASRAV